MYQSDSNRQSISSALPDGEVVALRLQQEAPDCEVGKLVNDCEVDGERNFTKTSNDRQLEQLLGNLLRYGVLIASTVVLVGGILYLIHHGAEPADYEFFQGEASVLRSPAGVVTAVLSGNRRGIVQFGLLLLIATPIVRVAISLLAFLRQRDFTYVIVTLMVLTGLIYSLLTSSLH